MITTWELREPRIAQKSLSSKWDGTGSVSGEVQLNNVTMTYQGRERPALENVSLTIKAGQTVAFCGPSGGGKSTVLALINRFYDPSSGTILIDGIDIQAVPMDEYRSSLGLVSQDAILYDGTFRENILLGLEDEEISDDELEKACSDAHILDFIRSLPEGFDTQVGLKGSQMSGGQRQRMCIARALLRNPRVLLVRSHLLCRTRIGINNGTST